MYRDMSERSEHFKLYKAGKTWIVAGIATLSFAVTSINQIADVHDDTPSTETSTSSSPVSSNVVPLSSAPVYTSTTPVSSSYAANSTTDGSSAAESSADNSSANDTASATSSDSSSASEQVTNLTGDVTSDDIKSAEAAADVQLSKTGIPQKITAVSATVAADSASSATSSNVSRLSDAADAEGNYVLTAAESGIEGFKVTDPQNRNTSLGKYADQDSFYTIAEYGVVSDQTEQSGGSTLQYSYGKINLIVEIAIAKNDNSGTLYVNFYDPSQPGNVPIASETVKNGKTLSEPYKYNGVEVSLNNDSTSFFLNATSTTDTKTTGAAATFIISSIYNQIANGSKITSTDNVTRFYTDPSSNDTYLVQSAGTFELKPSLIYQVTSYVLADDQGNIVKDAKGNMITLHDSVEQLGRHIRLQLPIQSLGIHLFRMNLITRTVLIFYHILILIKL